MELYTNLVQAKQTIDSGYEPPMTPIPEDVFHLIDSAFTIGLGAFYEDPEKGLRCPVRGCGVYRHMLRRHLNRHAELGGANAVLDALSVPRRMALVSQKVKRGMSERLLQRWAAGMQPVSKGNRGNRSAANASLKRTHSTVQLQNMRNSCEAQIVHRLWDLHNKIGRSPTKNEARISGEEPLILACIKLYGSWNAAKATVGMEKNSPRLRGKWSKENVLTVLRAWYDCHGRLPSSSENKGLPLLPSKTVFLNKFNTDKWPVAMRRAAINLNIYDARYRPAA